jgi:hypothetical protein
MVLHVHEAPTNLVYTNSRSCNVTTSLEALVKIAQCMNFLAFQAPVRCVSAKGSKSVDDVGSVL